MATIDGARALGLDHEIGSLEVGKAADIIAIDLSGAGYSETPDPETLLVYSGSGRDVRHVWVAGEQLVRDRALVRRDYADIRADYSDDLRRLLAARRRGQTHRGAVDMTQRPLILDTDGGVDDAQALLHAGRQRPGARSHHHRVRQCRARRGDDATSSPCCRRSASTSRCTRAPTAR